MNKTRLALVGAIALSLAAANTAMADSPEKTKNKQEKKHHQVYKGRESDDEHEQDCDEDEHEGGAGKAHKKTGIENALDHVKNPRAREVLQRNLERQKQKLENKVKTPQQIVQADAAALKIGFTGTDKISGVTQALTLPTAGKYGSTITWTSSNPAVIAVDGKIVVRPLDADVKVVLTATITQNGASVTKTFELIVKVQQNDAQIVAADKAALQLGFTGADNAGSVTSPLKLAEKGSGGSAITWVSGNPAVISNDGLTVTRPANADIAVTLTAKITKGAVTETKDFTVIVKKQITDVEKVEADKAGLQIGFGGNDTASNVTVKLNLPALGINGSIIVWYSSDPSVVGHDGTVIRPESGTGDKNVTLTALIVNNAAMGSKPFTLTVKQLP